MINKKSILDWKVNMKIVENMMKRNKITCKCDLGLEYKNCGNKDCFDWHIKMNKTKEVLTPYSPKFEFIEK